MGGDLCGFLLVHLRQFEKPLRLLFVCLSVCEELQRLVFVRLRLHEELKGLLADLVGLLFVRLRLLEKQQCLLRVRLRLAQRPLRLPLMLASVPGRGGGFDLALRRLPGVPRRFILMPGGVLIGHADFLILSDWNDRHR